jgi:hypothetical protein
VEVRVLSFAQGSLITPVLGTFASMSVVFDADDLWSTSNSIDETFWLANAPDELTLAQNFWRFSNGVQCNGYQPCCNAGPCSAPTMAEADVAFYVNRATTGAWNWNSGQPSAMVNTTTFPTYFAVTALHEFAHAFAIDHDAASQGFSTMDPGYPFGGWHFDEVVPAARATVMANTAANLSALHPGGASGVDVYSASTFHDSTPPAGSSFSRLLSCDAATSACDFYPRRTSQIPGQTFATARVGDSVKFRACWGNRGSVNQTTTLNFDIAFSSDTALDAGDPRVGNNTWSVASVPAGAATCSELTVVVPKSRMLPLAFGTSSTAWGRRPAEGSAWSIAR